MQSKGAGPHFWQFFAFFLPVSAEIDSRIPIRSPFGLDSFAPARSAIWPSRLPGGFPARRVPVHVVHSRDLHFRFHARAKSGWKLEKYSVETRVVNLPPRSRALVTHAPALVPATLAALPSTRAIETRSLPQLAHRYPRDFAFYVAFPKRSIPSLARCSMSLIPQNLRLTQPPLQLLVLMHHKPLMI